jgi:predicted ester cyclase
MSQQTTTTREKIDVKGGHVIEKVKDLLHEGNVRRIIIKDSDDKTMLEMPVTVGVVGFLAAPTMAAIGALAALAADYSIEVEREHAETPSEIKREENTMGAGRNLLERAIEIYNDRDLDGYVNLYAEDAVLTTPDGVYRGRNEIREYFARQLNAFPDCTFTMGTFVEQGDLFADEFVFAGTHNASYLLPDGTELPPTGKRVEIKAMEFVRVRDGEMVVDNLYWDSKDYLVQLGLVPQPVAVPA